jgi:hypothetical protein
MAIRIGPRRRFRDNVAGDDHRSSSDEGCRRLLGEFEHGLGVEAADERPRRGPPDDQSARDPGAADHLEHGAGSCWFDRDGDACGHLDRKEGEPRAIADDHHAVAAVEWHAWAQHEVAHGAQHAKAAIAAFPPEAWLQTPCAHLEAR